MPHRLGRLPHDPAILGKLPRLSSYAPPVAPDVVDWSRDTASWGMLGNNTLGNCTAAAALHAQALWGSYRPPFDEPVDADAVALYSATGGYVPGDPATDNGARCLDVLNYWRTHGIDCGSADSRLTAFCTLDPKNIDHLRSALWCFGAVYVGLTLHVAQQDESVWNDTSSPVWGGHCVLIVAADPKTITCVTWGAIQRMTYPFWIEVVDEAYALLSPSWLASGRAPQGFPIAALMQDMAALKV